MAEEFVKVGEVSLCFEQFGDPRDPALLLIRGLGTQMIGWDDDLCEQLAATGRRVIRFDNRDIGRSSRIDGPKPAIHELALGRVRNPAYTLSTMAADSVGLLDRLEIDAAHVVGVSMGAMIGQTMAIEQPGRVRTLTSIMSTTGARKVGQPARRALPHLLKRSRTADDAAAQLVGLYRVVGSPGFPRDEDAIRAFARRSWERAPNDDGGARQLGAILGSGDRTAALKQLTTPTLVIHGTADRLIAPSGGHATAAAIPGAELLLIDGMGHDLPRGAWPQIIGAIADHTAA